jgi:hypothetical protein
MGKIMGKTTELPQTAARNAEKLRGSGSSEDSRVKK